MVPDDGLHEYGPTVDRTWLKLQQRFAQSEHLVHLQMQPRLQPRSRPAPAAILASVMRLETEALATSGKQCSGGKQPPQLLKTLSMPVLPPCGG